ncbi:MAG: hypothetical protein N2235_03140 [Fischerella sp.]|nr:hypothetical protein [Fischerella sp.]
MKLTQNALRWPTRITSLLVSSFLLVGCQSTAPLKVETAPREKVPLNTPMPEPLQISPPRWVVITPDNAARVWEELTKNKVPLVLFALTPDGYKELSLDLAEIRSLLSQQREIIIQYKEYYEPKVKEDAKFTK